MSEDESSGKEQSVRAYRIREGDHWETWREKTLGIARAKGFERFLNSEVKVKTEDELDTLELDLINLSDETKKEEEKG